ncbi:zinc finger MYM-type protein 1-like [Sinocyclocheilus rhinocerous]|uniref:zinc finger MYM-type protein 1-like n=1 Tax=Sinocyclocheilus rhinocerous TaxID=307959 RepID=UPI0007BA7ECF|nr:PREDICTED: zinc finger MYM-type protein 1-like [Sinocyclocheilus rhinocerous]
MNLLSNSIIRKIAQEIAALPVVQYSIIMDGTQDISGVEKVSICIHYVNTDLEPREEFVGLYEASSTTGEQIGKIASDVLLRLNLPFSSLRGQTYDGAANMSGQPLATFVHCGPHCVNLVTQAACSAAPIIRDSLQWIHELGCLFGQSGKFKTIFKSVAKSTSGCYTTLKPLCPTRWTVRTPAINSVLTQYEAVLTALEKMASSSTHDTASKANGLRERFQKGNTVLGLLLTQDIMIGLEGLNTSLQGREATVGGMLSAVECVKNGFQNKRSDVSFRELYIQASEVVTSLDLEAITVPHLRRPSTRHAGPAQPYIPTTAEEYYRVQFFLVLDTVMTQLTHRFEQEGLRNIVMLENVLISGQVNDIVELYPELESQSLKVQMAMFRANYKYQSCTEVVNILKNMVPEVRRLFKQVETLVLLLI